MAIKSKIVGGAAALALAAGLTAAVPNEAAAQWRHHGGWHHGWRGPGVAAGVVGGLALGALAAGAANSYYAPAYGYYPPPPPPPLYAAGPGDAHIQWCSAHFRSYSPETNLWVDYDGVMHQCVAPY